MTNQHSNSPKTKVPKKPYRRFKTSLNDHRSHRQIQDTVTYDCDEKKHQSKGKTVSHMRNSKTDKLLN